MKTVSYAICLILLLLTSASAKNTNAIKVEVLTKVTSSWDGNDLPSYAKGKPEVSILKIVIPPGASTTFHKHPAINAGVLISGELTVVTEDKLTLNMKAGDTIVEVVNRWHYGKNEGEQPVEIIVFYAGIQGMPLSIKKPVSKPQAETQH